MDELTDEQVENLGSRLLLTEANVYNRAHQMFGVTVEEDIFDRLRSVCRIFRCDFCSKWLPIRREVAPGGMCDSCLP